MTGTRRNRTLGQLLAAAILAHAGATAADDPAAAGPCTGKIPAELAVPAGNALVLALDAAGVQIYECTKGAWTLKGPEASLLERGRQVGRHYGGPTWEADDGSKVKGTKVAGASVDATAVPWLLLKGEASGSGRLGEVTFVQRVNTSGGQPPPGACTATDKPTPVPYTATYCFYAAAEKR
jgi:hypothetical protein